MLGEPEHVAEPLLSLSILICEMAQFLLDDTVCGTEPLSKQKPSLSGQPEPGHTVTYMSQLPQALKSCVLPGSGLSL